MEEPIDLPRSAWEDPLKWLKEYDRVANFNKWDDMMCLANVYFFLDGTARQWYVNNEDALDSWEAFKNGLSGLFGDRQKYTRRAEEQLKCRAQRSGESTQSYIQSVLGLCQEVNPLMKEDEKVSHLMKGVAEDIYQALLTREINDTASFIKWCNYIEDMKQKRVGRPRFERLPNVVPVASLTDETDLVSLIHTIVREEVHRLVNQTQESLDSDPQSLEEIVQDEVERVLAPVSTKPTENRPRPTYAAVTRKYRAPVQKFPPEPRKTDVWRTADNRPVCFHCGRPGHKKYADQTLLAVLRQVPREADPQYVVTDPRRHIADPVSRQAVGARKTKESDLQGGEAACTGNPPSTAKMTGNQLDVIIDKKPIRALVDSGASFSVISDKYRRFLKKVLFADAKSVMLKVADGNFVRPIGKCVLRVRINNRELPFEFIVLSHCSHDVILGWDFLEASQAVIDCGQNELVLEDICRDSTAPDAWNLYATRDYTLKPHSLTRITVSGYQTRGDINVVLDGSKYLLFEKNIATPSMVSTYRNGKSDVWVTNLQFETKSSLEECA
ncbi:transposon Ty3-I Gag-Pol polyprotein [Trichonephila clavipes]|uniref:Transposon Ty3-I Gag-Pol polyprotein n=1 Tax=Trichonephila clavipes TaxID=2585209 RepID=A0A8X6VXN3_TRICX|nr:transposon Ty3-I Gag-Pol polyprotein [Trichonephila clavipes]